MIASFFLKTFDCIRVAMLGEKHRLIYYVRSKMLNLLPNHSKAKIGL